MVGRGRPVFNRQMFEGTIAGGDSPRALGSPLEDGNVRLKQAHQQRTGMPESTDPYWKGLAFLKCHWPSCLYDSFSSPGVPHFLGTGHDAIRGVNLVPGASGPGSAMSPPPERSQAR